MLIGQLSRQAGVPIDTVRYYERNGLLPMPSRRDSGYRDYHSRDVAQLRFVRRAKALGFTLSEIRELLALSHHREQDMSGFKAVGAAKLAVLDAKLAELNRVRQGLHALLEDCPGQGALGECPILAALSGDEA